MSAATGYTVQGDLDSPLPLRADGGKLTGRGWCLINGCPEPPPVRVVAATFTHVVTHRAARDDVRRQLPAEPAASACGFTFDVHVPAGIHLARFEAQLPDGGWAGFKTLCLAAPAAPFAAGIDQPVTDQTVTTRVHVEGWALDPKQAVTALSVRYGHQDIPCEIGRPRTDLAATYPDSPHAARAGFKSKVILSAGRGPLRLRARLADGSLAIARTPMEVAIATDENHGPEINLAAARVALPRIREEPPPPAAASDQRHNVLFILPGSFAANSALHVAALANELAASGHACVVAVPHDPETLAHHRNPRFRGVTYQEAEQAGLFADGRGPDIIHAWTTRENVRRLATVLHRRHAARLLVHLEDNESLLLAHTLGRSADALAALPEAELERLLPPDLSHPRRSREFLAQADGVTVITERLREFVPAGKPCLTLWPAADARFFRAQPIPADFRSALAFPPGTTVLFYHGNVHAANAADMRELYAAVAQLNEAGHPVTLIRTGLDQVDFLGPWADRVRPHVLALGQILQHRHLPALMALADIFVQPGCSDAFNDYRFPSKLPEFFAIGRPVVLPRANLGLAVRHGVDAYVLERADAAGIRQAILALRADPAWREKLGRGALAFAEQHFSWRRSAAALANFHAALPTS